MVGQNGTRILTLELGDEDLYFNHFPFPAPARPGSGPVRLCCAAYLGIRCTSHLGVRCIVHSAAAASAPIFAALVPCGVNPTSRADAMGQS